MQLSSVWIHILFCISRRKIHVFDTFYKTIYFCWDTLSDFCVYYWLFVLLIFSLNLCTHSCGRSSHDTALTEPKTHTDTVHRGSPGWSCCFLTGTMRNLESFFHLIYQSSGASVGSGHFYFYFIFRVFRHLAAIGMSKLQYQCFLRNRLCVCVFCICICKRVWHKIIYSKGYDECVTSAPQSRSHGYGAVFHLLSRSVAAAAQNCVRSWV